MDLNDRRQLPLFSIGTVQKLTGLSARQIRYYEEHELVQPARSAGQQRQFSFADVERLMLIRELLDAGHNMASVKRNLIEGEQGRPRATHQSKPDMSDSEVYTWLKRDMQDGRGQIDSLFQGDLSRFYRKR
jgi:MerR family transcriptional regulator, glutamine synthetase repressor